LEDAFRRVRGYACPFFVNYEPKASISQCPIEHCLLKGIITLKNEQAMKAVHLLLTAGFPSWRLNIPAS